MSKTAPAIDLKAALLRTFAANERINQYLLEHLPGAAWDAPAPGGKSRTIAAIVAHMHNVRLMWITAAGKNLGIAVPEKLDPADCTQSRAAQALAESAAVVRQLLAAALDLPDAKVRDFRPDAVHFIGYLVAHDAHHRGQVSLLARQAGHPLSKSANFGLWQWGSRADEA